MAIVKSKDGRYFNIDDSVLEKCEVDVLDLPEGAAFGEADNLSAEELDGVVGGSGEYRRYRKKSAVLGIRG